MDNCQPRVKTNNRLLLSIGDCFKILHFLLQNIGENYKRCSLYSAHKTHWKTEKNNSLRKNIILIIIIILFCVK